MLNYKEYLKRLQLEDERVHSSSVSLLKDGYFAFIRDEVSKITKSGPCRTLKDMTKKEIKKLEQLYNTKITVDQDTD